MKTVTKPTHYLNYNEQKALEGILQKIPSMYPMINKIILYGSKARGDFIEESDVDILFITDYPIPRAMKFELYDMIYELQIKYDVVISAIFSTASDFQSASKPFLRQIHLDGITLWSRE
ncbi:MAG: nucleotidyltransferase domain-containing protein [Nitrospirae bacterium]|nr:nucleotidyltransferase domain-containing protein [Nitrospirota bacterium]